MTDVLSDATVLAERYIAAWNTTDPAARRQVVDELYTEDARYVDPLVDARGREAIDATIAAAQARFPGCVFRLAGPVDAHHDLVRFTWDLPAGRRAGRRAGARRRLRRRGQRRPGAAADRARVLDRVPAG
jgi:hypothetical protein